ncbi:MAG: hypothetical protein Q8R97_07475 [Brevundimonas sp.]|nr:hypothetical protein [Brevundimonas sp.]
MLTVKQLNAHLEALALPDAVVFAQGADGVPFALQGGYPGATSEGLHYVILARSASPPSLGASDGRRNGI